MIQRAFLVTLSLVSLASCSGGTTPPGGHSASGQKAAGPATARPPIHYEQTAVLTMDGQPKEEAVYAQALAACQKAGGAVHALTPDEVAKLGRVHVEAWIGPDKESRHEEEWGMLDTPPCRFSLSHVDRTEIQDSSGHSTAIDGETHQVDVQEVGPWGPIEPLPASDGELTEAEQHNGWSKQGSASANGAPCAVWRDANEAELCVWNAGRQWGFSADGANVLKNGVSHGGVIVLWAHPGRVPGWKLETKELTVGVPLDARAFSVNAVTNRGASP